MFHVHLRLLRNGCDCCASCIVLELRRLCTDALGIVNFHYRSECFAPRATSGPQGAVNISWIAVPIRWSGNGVRPLVASTGGLLLTYPPHLAGRWERTVRMDRTRRYTVGFSLQSCSATNTPRHGGYLRTCGRLSSMIPLMGSRKRSYSPSIRCLQPWGSWVANCYETQAAQASKSWSVATRTVSKGRHKGCNLFHDGGQQEYTPDLEHLAVYLPTAPACA